MVLFNFQVTKLCDLGPNDGVCSVQWTREGSYISIGTNLGQVQVTYQKIKIEVLRSSFITIVHLFFYCYFNVVTRYGMGVNARKLEPWEGIKQELAFWHGILGY